MERYPSGVFYANQGLESYDVTGASTEFAYEFVTLFVGDSINAVKRLNEHSASLMTTSFYNGKKRVETL